MRASIDHLSECSRRQVEAAGAFKQAEARIFLVDAQKRDEMNRYRAMRDEAASCAARTERELLQKALPALEQRCANEGQTACAAWAKNQRVWRSELTQTQQSIEGCYGRDDRAALKRRIDSISDSAYTDTGFRTVAQQVRDLTILYEQYDYIATRERDCAAPFGAKAAALREAIEGKDRAAEARATRLTNIKTLYDLVEETLRSNAPPPGRDLPERVAGLAAVVKASATQSIADHPDQGPAINALIETAEGLYATDIEWRKEQVLRSEKENLERRREAARVEDARRRTSVSKLELDIAEENLKGVVKKLSDLEQRCTSRWEVSRTKFAVASDLKTVGK